MTFDRLDAILDTYKAMADDIADNNTAKAMLAQSMVVGVEGSVQLVIHSNTWVTALSFLQSAIVDIPVSENPEIAARVLNVANELWPTFISTASQSNKKTNHIAGILTKLIQEIRDAPTS
jgi:predicted ATP-grasp superfamily ATP-dependent carboligase